VLTIELKYYEGRPVIDRIERVSRPDCAYTVARMKFRACSRHGHCHRLDAKGVMTDKAAHAIGQGGEVLCIVA